MVQIVLKRRFIKTLFLIIAGLFFLAPQGFANSMKDTLVAANYDDIRDLNPHLYGGEIFAQNMLFEGLVFLDQQGDPQPWLATSWKVSSDGTKYTFAIRKGVSFSDGTPFDAHIVKKNFDALLDNGKRHGWLESIRLMVAFEKSGHKSVNVLDDYTVEVNFSDSYYPFIVELGMTRPFRFLSPKCFKEGMTKNGVSCLVGTASYVLETHQLDEYAEFVVNPNYWGKKPEIKKIVIKVIPDNQARMWALQKGEIDMIYGLQLIFPRNFRQFEKTGEFGTVMSDPLSTRMLILNTQSPTLKDVKVRQALQHLTNKKIISENIMLGLEAPADTLFSRTVPYADIDLPAYEVDPAKAAALLQEAGWTKDGQVFQKNGKPLEIIVLYDSDKVIEKTIAQFLQSEWKKHGVLLRLQGEEAQSHRDRLNGGRYDIAFHVSWGVPYDPQSFMGGMRKPAHGDMVAQQGLKQKKKIDDTILAALKTVDEQDRQNKYTYVLETLHNEAVYIPLTYERNRAIFNKRVKNVGFNPSQFEIPFDRMKVE